MTGVPFTKMSAAGNDFILVDNRAGILAGFDLSEFARRVCARRISLGADELILIESPSAGGDFSMRTINPDGQEVAMCGNASRCVARFAATRSIAGPRMTIDTLGGPVHAWVEGDEARVQFQVTAPPILNRPLAIHGEELLVHWIEICGTPHAVVFLPGAAEAPVEMIHQNGAALRFHPAFPQGTNANFIDVIDRHTLQQRTYERGVEGETLACGTGAAASTVISGLLDRVESPVRVRVQGGELTVTYRCQTTAEGSAIRELFQGGPARFIAEGILHPEAWTSVPPT
jgi:diaminopimelate epimerase